MNSQNQNTDMTWSSNVDSLGVFSGPILLHVQLVAFVLGLVHLKLVKFRVVDHLCA